MYWYSFWLTADDLLSFEIFVVCVDFRFLSFLSPIMSSRRVLIAWWFRRILFNTATPEIVAVWTTLQVVSLSLWHRLLTSSPQRVANWSMPLTYADNYSMSDSDHLKKKKSYRRLHVFNKLPKMINYLLPVHIFHTLLK